MDSEERQARFKALLKELIAQLPEAEDRLMEFIGELEKRKYDKAAIDVLRRAVDSCPTPRLQRTLGIRCVGSGEYSEGLEHLDSYLAQLPTDGEAHLYMAAACAAGSQNTKAEHHLDRAREFDVSEERIASVLQYEVEKEATSSADDTLVEAEEPTLLLNRDELDETTEQDRWADIEDAPDGQSSVMRQRVPEATNTFPRPAAPYDSDLILTKAEAAVQPSGSGDTNPFGSILEREKREPLPDTEVAASDSEASNRPEEGGSEDPPAQPKPPVDDPLSEAMDGPDAPEQKPRSAQPQAPQPKPPQPKPPQPKPPQPKPPRPAKSQPEQPRKPRRDPAELSASSSGDDKSRSTTIPGLNSPVVFGAIGVAVLVAVVSWVAVTHVQYNRLEAVADDAQTQRFVPDTYDSHLEALHLLETAEQQTRLLPRFLDGFIFDVIPALPGKNVAQRRDSIAADAAEVAAFVQWRFEDGDSGRIDLEEGSDGETAAVKAAHTYRRLLEGDHFGALEVARSGWEHHPDHPLARRALATVLLEIGTTEVPGELRERLAETGEISVWDRLLSARLDFVVGGDEEAESLRRFIREYPEHVDAQVELALTTPHVDDRRKEAMETLRTLRDEPDGELGAFQKARIAYALGRLTADSEEADEAREYFEEAIEQAPERHEHYGGMVDFFIDRADFEAADETLDEMSDRLSAADHPELIVRRARVALLTGHTDRARELVEDLEVSTPESHWLAGLANLELHRPGSAYVAFRSAQEADPAWTVQSEAYALYAGLLEEPDADPEEVLEQIEVLLDDDAQENNERQQAAIYRARALAEHFAADATFSRTQRRRSLRSARDALQRAYELDPTDLMIRYDLCFTQLELGQREKAEEICETAFEHAPAYRPGAMHFVRLRLRQGRYGDAHELLEQIAEHHDHDSQQMSLLRVLTYAGLGEFEDAQQILDELGEPADDADHRLVAGRLAFAKHDYETARKHFEAIRELDADHHEAGYLLGNTLVRVGEWDEADELLLDLLAAPIWGGKAWYALGELRRRQERFSDARTNLSRAEERLDEHIFPPHTQVLIDVERALAWQTRRGWDHSRVADYLEAAADHTDEPVPELLVAEGRYHHHKRRSDPSAARSALEEAVEIAPRYCEGWEALEALHRGQRNRGQLQEVRDEMPPDCS